MKIAKEQLGFRFGNEEIKNSIATADNRTVLLPLSQSDLGLG